MKKVLSVVFNDFKHDSRVLKEVMSLNNHGFSITVVALYSKALLEHEMLNNNVFVHRIKLKTSFVNIKVIGAILKRIEFILTVVSMYKEMDYIHCHDLDMLPIGYLIKKFFNKKSKVIYDAHEYEVEIAGLRWSKRIVYRYMERHLIRHADKTITVSDSIANEYVRLYGIEKPALVLNTPPYQEIEKKDIFRDTFSISKEQTVFLYQGGLSAGRGIDILLETFTTVEDDKVIVFMGYGALEDLIRDYASKYNNIFYHEAVSPKVLLDYTSSADFGILFYENNCLNHYYCSPNKMFEYIMAEIPVVVSNLFEMEKIVKNNNIGVVAEENSSLGLKQAIDKISKLKRSLLHKNVQAVKAKYNWEQQEKVLINLYKELDNNEN